MKKLAVTLLAVMFMLTFTFNTAATDITAKSYGMGGAYTGLADDATAMLYNPAGLSDSGFMGLQFEFGMGASNIDKMSELIGDIEYFAEDFDVNSPEDIKDINELFNDFPIINVDNQIFAGGNFSSFGVGFNIDNRFDTNKPSDEIINATNITNTSGILSISRDLNTDYKEIIGISYGVNIKTLRTDYVEVELVNSATNKKASVATAKGSGVGLDAGVLVNFTPKLKFGANFKNILAPDYDLEGEKEVYDYLAAEGANTDTSNFTKTYSPKQSYRLGASLDIPVINGTVVGDIENYTDSDKSVIHLGVEKRLMFNGLSLRGGMYNPSDEDPTLTMGLGFNLASLHFDMAIGSNDGFSINLNGAASLNFQF
ncbi:MAG TPA: hypothetical protein VKN64_11725 [Halanaerobiales bacterium]|nr:hypothetical protein [Halanaerobiales bacterium]